MNQNTEAIARQLAMSVYHYPPQDSELGFEMAVKMIQRAIDTAIRVAVDEDRQTCSCRND